MEIRKIFEYPECLTAITVLYGAQITPVSYAADATSFKPQSVATASASSVDEGTIIARPLSSLPPLDGGFQKWGECKDQNLTQAAYPELFAEEQAQEVA